MKGISELSANTYKASKAKIMGTVISNVNVRHKPSTSSKILATLQKNQKVRVLGRYGKSWYHVAYKQKKAWVWSKNLRIKVLQQKKEAIKRKPAPSLEIIQSPSARQPEYNKLSPGSELYDRYQSYSNFD